jgi:hypothetical protein
MTTALPAKRRPDARKRFHQAEDARRHQKELNQPAIALLQSWLEDDEESPDEQRRALEWLMRELDEDRPSDRKLFR